MDTAARATATLASLDWATIALYFPVLATVAWWVVSTSKKRAIDHFLAGRTRSWWIVGASIVASNVGSEHVVGMAA
jgi:SSS family solute:Na+ symporter